MINSVTQYSKGNDTVCVTTKTTYGEAVLQALKAQSTLPDCSIAIGNCSSIPLQVTCDTIVETLIDDVHFEKWENDGYLVFDKQALTDAVTIIEQVFGARREALLKNDKVLLGPFQLGCYVSKNPQASSLFCKIQSMVYDAMCATFNLFYHEYQFEGLLNQLEFAYISLCLERIATTFILFYSARNIAKKVQTINYPEYCFSIAVSEFLDVKPHRLAIGSSYITNEILEAYQRLFDSYAIPLTALHKQSLLGVGWDFHAKIVKVYSTQKLSETKYEHQFSNTTGQYRAFCLVSDSFDIASATHLESKVYAYAVEKVPVAENKFCECAFMYSNKRGLVKQYDAPLSDEEVASQTYMHPLHWHLNDKVLKLSNFTSNTSACWIALNQMPSPQPCIFPFIFKLVVNMLFFGCAK